MANDRNVASVTGTARQDFCERMVSMIDNEEFSDISITCKDKRSISASRLQLMSGSSNLKELISKAWKKASGFQRCPKDVKITLDNITSTTLRFILEFLYTGEMFPPGGQEMKTVEQAVHIIRASKSLDLEVVKQIVTEHLDNMRKNLKDEIFEAALRLSVSINDDIKVERHSESNPDLAEILKIEDLTPAHLCLLSLEAFRFYLQCNNKPSYQIEEHNERSHQVEEYTRFRQIILWCIIQVKPNIPNNEIAKLLPNRQQARELLQGISLPDEINYKILESVGDARHEFNGLMEELMGQVDFSRMHPQHLSQVVQPSKVVPQKDIDRAYDLIAQRRAQRSSWRWEHGSCYKSEGDDGLTIAKCESGTGLATYLRPISRDSRVSKWTVTVLELCDEFCEIGFHEDSPTPTVGTLFEQPMGFSLRSTAGLKNSEINLYGGEGNKWRDFEGNFAYQNASVTFKLDMNKGTCDIRIGEGNYEEGWKFLPTNSTFYPAVSLGIGEHGKVRIEFDQ